MSDDWRVRADLGETGHVHHLVKGLHEREVEHDLAERLRHRLPVTHSDTSVFVYAGDEAAASHAAELVREVLADHDLTGEVAIDRWHREGERWEPADVPLPRDARGGGGRACGARAARGAPRAPAAGAQWEVRIDVASPRTPRRSPTTSRPRASHPLRRWKHVFVSVATDDEARALADRLRAELPEATAVIPEGTAAQAWQATHPFAVLGGIAN